MVTEMFRWVKVYQKDNDELVYMGVIQAIDAAHPLVALRANYSPTSHKTVVVAQNMTFDEVLSSIGNKLKEYFDANGCYPRDNQKKFLKNYAQIIQEVLASFSEPIILDEENVSSRIEEGHPYGNYIYGHYKNREFVVDYIGRCTQDELQDRIMHRWDKNDNNYNEFEKRGVSHVRFRYAESEDEAINIECLLYHYYRGKQNLINNEHPSRENEPRHCIICDEVQNLINTKI